MFAPDQSIYHVVHAGAGVDADLHFYELELDLSKGHTLTIHIGHIPVSVVIMPAASIPHITVACLIHGAAFDRIRLTVLHTIKKVFPADGL